MIGMNISESEYRELDMISYSLLSGISRSGNKSLKEEFVSNYATKFGVLTESILFGDYNPDDYYIFPSNVIPSDKLKDACDIIFPKLLIDPKIKEDLSEYESSIELIISHTYVDFFNNRTHKSRAKTIVKDAAEYWQHLSKVGDKIVISQDMLDAANSAVQTLKTHQFTSHIFNKDTFFNVDKYSQVKLSFNYKGREFKSMLDWLVIDHDKKIIRPYDLKTGGKSIDKFHDSFYYWRYDIQAFLYTLAVSKFRDKWYPNYGVEYFRFVYISREDLNRPIVYKINNKILDGTLKGFSRNGEQYEGLLKLIEDYEWYLNNETAQYTRDVYKSNGELCINDDIKVKDAREN